MKVKTESYYNRNEAEMNSQVALFSEPYPDAVEGVIKRLYQA